MIITRTSILSGVKHTRDINITPKQILKLKRGESIWEEVHLDPYDEQFILKGLTVREWIDSLPVKDPNPEDLPKENSLGLWMPFA